MEFTKRYGIAKHGPQGDEEALSAYSIVNIAMDRIDELFWDVNAQITEINAKLSVFNDRITKNENEIANLYNKLAELESSVNASVASLWAAINAIIDKVNGGGAVDEGTGDVTWVYGGKIAVGNMNVYSNGYAIRTTVQTETNPGTGDVKVQ